MITLSDEQRNQLQQNGHDQRVLDPVTCTEYVLVRVDVYARVRELLEKAEDDAVQEAWADTVEEARAHMANE